MSSWDLYKESNHSRRSTDNISNKSLNTKQLRKIRSKEKCTNETEIQQSFDFSFTSRDEKQKSASKRRDVGSLLPLNVWPVGELSEIRTKNDENIFHLLLPILSKLSSENRWITLISPPAGVDKKLFAYHGIDISRVLLIHPKDAVDDTATMNKALKNGNSGIVIMWTEKLVTRFVAQWRKSVKQGNCRGIIVNHDFTEACSPSVALALDVKSSDKAITIISTQKFGRKTKYRAKRSFPIVDLNSRAHDLQDHQEPFFLVS